MTKDEAMQQALEALEVAMTPLAKDRQEVLRAITALRTAMLQPPLPEQEPDRRALQAAGTHPAPCARHCEAKAFEIEIRGLKSALKQAQQVQEPVACRFCHSKKGSWTWQCYKCGEIDDVQQPALPLPVQPEPLEYWNAVEGWVKIDEVREHFDAVGCGTIYKTAGEDRVPLYTAPPQREWVGLTVTTILNMMPSTIPADYDGELMEFAQAIEAKLKEKNHG